MKRSSIENVQEESVKLGKKAIGFAASAAISALNAIEQVRALNMKLNSLPLEVSCCFCIFVMTVFRGPLPVSCC